MTEEQRAKAEKKARNLYLLSQNLPIDFDEGDTELKRQLQEIHTHISYLVSYLERPY